MQGEENFKFIYNVDETGLQVVPSKPKKVLAATGSKMVQKITSAERGSTHTAVVCRNSEGTFILPMVIFKAGKITEEMKQGFPFGTC